MYVQGRIHGPKGVGAEKFRLAPSALATFLPILHVLKIMVLKHPKNDSCAKNTFSGKSKKFMYLRKMLLGGNNECILRAP